MKEFDYNYHSTIGFDYSKFNIRINNKIIKLQIWDICGVEIFQRKISNSSLAIIVYSIDK